ncbi:MAG: acetate kinase superfamily protein [Candidatus Aramenus sulfurataquae]|jgi:predicted butyrate kinase (DUF1464 family)|uniref:Acetate kinase n=2 Tax=Candidatus Aramenus sulfurataquae TaxID=1326980 RepID=W7KJ28_9CREN|nr:MAG: acetate kinase superfamily protein [Candidatus Aramenus sulfurataquae]MCL7343280.1 DUF1464 family protein [Candidatus Aramenus sulfurataquae]
MLFVGVDPGSESYAISAVDELGRVVKYLEVPTSLVVKASPTLVSYILAWKPKLVALPSGHGLPLIKAREIGAREIFLLTLSDPDKEGPLHSFLKSFRGEGITIPSVIELDSVPEYRKVNTVDMGTADKVASAFFYRTLYDSFVLLEAGRHFYSILVVVDGKIVDGFGGTYIPGPVSPGAIDGEVAYLLSKYSRITKETIYSGGNERRAKEIARIISEWYSQKYDIPIIVSGRGKDEIDWGIKLNVKFKEASVGASLIANALGGGIYRVYVDMLKSSNTPISFVRLKGWEEITSLIRTL